MKKESTKDIDQKPTKGKSEEPVKKSTIELAKEEAIAQVCHAANKTWCAVNGYNTHKDWKDVSDELKQSAISGVKFRQNYPSASPALQHETWMNRRLKDGWKYGKEKDEKEKTHPCLVPYEELPLIERQKDILFAAIVDALS